MTKTKENVQQIYIQREVNLQQLRERLNTAYGELEEVTTKVEQLEIQIDKIKEIKQCQ